MIAAIIVVSIFGWVIYKLISGGSNTKECPYGYQDYGCQPICPLYEHCWGSRQDSDSDLGHGFLSDNMTAQQEDGDWRTVYMDDTRYYDRECDEEFDHDLEDNGGW